MLGPAVLAPHCSRYKSNIYSPENYRTSEIKRKIDVRLLSIENNTCIFFNPYYGSDGQMFKMSASLPGGHGFKPHIGLI